ncbi:MAG TPA: glutamate-1-semialdehyde 2,1-aminomutase [Planctomycetota bacterium]|nr:glutamate-1-semialdehyde 2,1-aminomutase [Planctomycetota bacterium]
MSDWLQRARKAMPGGVSSPVRAFGAVRGDPPFVACGRGAEIFDVDGRAYVDLLGSWGPLILGHAHPAVLEAVERAVRDGLSFGATCPAEVELAEAVLKRFPFAGKVRFVSTGTEAVMSAVRLARGFTRRERIVKFEGCYHGHCDALMVKGGSGLATFGVASSAGVPAAVVAMTEVLPLDDIAAIEELFARRGSEIASVVIEPLPANAGLLVQRAEFLRALRRLTREHGALLHFDEVISGFRVAPGGMTERFGIEPDIVTLGKILGGGMPVGAYLAPEAIMQHVAPLGPVYQAGTLSGNPVAMAAGIATLRELERPGIYERLEELGAALEEELTRSLRKAGVAHSVSRVGSILGLWLQAGDAPRAFHRVDARAAEKYAQLHPLLLEGGVWMAPSYFEVAFVSLAHDESHIARVGRALDGALERLGGIVA